MKHFLVTLAVLVLTAPVQAQDNDAGSGTDTGQGPDPSDIAGLLELLDSGEPETPARDEDAPPAGLSLRGDDGSEIAIQPDSGARAGDAPAAGPANEAEDADTGADSAGTPVDTDAAEDPSRDGPPEQAPAPESPGDAETPNEIDEAVVEETGNGEPRPEAEIADETAGPATPETGTADDSMADDGEITGAAATATPDGITHALTPSAPFLTSTQYAELRPGSAGEALELVWSVQRGNAAGEPAGAATTHTLIIAPDFVRDEGPEGVSVYDFLTSRHLEVDTAAGTMTNTAFAAEVRRRLDTYLGLSQGGRLTDIPLGADRSFDRFWLEAAMGIRRDPASLTRRYAAGELTVERSGGLTVLSARFDVGSLDNPGTAADAAPETANDDEDTGPVSISEAARPVDLSSGESVVFDLSQVASPINLDRPGAAVAYPDGNPAEQAQAEVFRRWMRHALPIHPDALEALEGAPRIPEEFAFFVVSPESPEGRREVWTLQSIESVEPGFRLAPGLEPDFDGRELIRDRLVPVARSAIETGIAADPQAFADELEMHRSGGDLVRAWLVSLQEQNHNGACPPAARTAHRPVCAEVTSLVSAGLGDAAFEAFYGLIAGPAGTGHEQMVEVMAPYRNDDNLAGAAARVLTARALLAWAARDPEGPPADLSPFDLFAEALEIDPAASGVWWETGNALLFLRDPLPGWAVFDTGRAVLPPDSPGMLQQATALEDRLRTLAPEFFLPR